MSASTALITGANSGLGFHAAARLAKLGYTRVVLVARTIEKAEAARARLVEEVGSDPFEVLAADMGDFASVRAAAAALEGGGLLDYVLLNAGLVGGATVEHADEGVELAMAASVVGHHLLTTTIADSGLIREGGTIVIAGSEAARGDMPTMGLTDVPAFAAEHTGGHREKAIDALLRGRPPYVYKNMPNYAMVKVFVAWWASALSRRLHNGIRVYAVSPGATANTNAYQHQPAFMRFVMDRVMVPMMRLAGKAHTLDVAIDRYLAPLSWTSDRSGEFWASKPGMGHAVGPLEKMTHAHFADIESQEALWSVLVRVTQADLAPVKLSQAG
jgi:NAD(P)-dependent dehydrogenase (short-subunit alcohol dehydrogenase family)